MRADTYITVAGHSPCLPVSTEILQGYDSVRVDSGVRMSLEAR